MTPNTIASASMSSISARVNQSSINETKRNEYMILFSAIGSAGGLSLFLCVCGIIISVCTFMNFKSKRNSYLKTRLVVHMISTNNDVIPYTENMKENVIIKINVIWQQQLQLIIICTMYMIMITMIFPQIAIKDSFSLIIF